MEMEKQCRACRSPIASDAAKCKYCGTWQGTIRFLLGSFYSKAVAVIILLILSMFFTAEYMDPEGKTKKGLTPAQLDSVIITPLNFRIDKSECYDKKLIGNLEFENELSRPIASLNVHVVLKRNDSVLYTFSSYILTNLVSKSHSTESLEKPFKMADAMAFDKAVVTAISGNFSD